MSATGRTTLPTVSVTREPARSADHDIRATSVRAARCFCRGCRASCGFRGFRSDSGFGCDFCGFRDSWSDSSFWKNSGSGCDFRFWFGCGRGRGFRSVELPAGCPAGGPVVAARIGCATRSTTQATDVGGAVGVRPSAA